MPPSTRKPGVRPGEKFFKFGSLVLGASSGAQAAFTTAPLVTAITPNSDRLAGGASVTITGANFIDGATVQIGQQEATSVVVVDADTITCVVPEAAVDGAVDVVVFNPNGESGTLTLGFTYVVGQILTLTPTRGAATGGTRITIIGVNFVDGSTIEIGGLPATDVIFIDKQHFFCTTPAHPTGVVDVVITEPGGAEVTGRKLYTFTSAVFQDDIRRNPSITIRDTLNSGQNIATFTIDGTGAQPRGGDKVILTDGDVLIFAGQVLHSEQVIEDSRYNVAWHVTAGDHRFRFNKKRPFGTFNNQHADVVVKYLVETFCAGFTTEFVQTDLPRVSIVMDGTDDMATVLTKICQKMGEGHWYIDYQRRLHFYRVPPMTKLGAVSALELPALGPVTVAESTTSTLGYDFKPGYYYFQVTGVYGDGTKTFTASPVDTPPGYVQLSDQAATLALTGTVDVGSYAVPFEGQAAPTEAVTNITLMNFGAVLEADATYTWCYTWERISDGTETLPSPASNSVHTGGGVTRVGYATNIPAPPAGYRHRFYRTAKNGSTFYRLPDVTYAPWGGSPSVPLGMSVVVSGTGVYYFYDYTPDSLLGRELSTEPPLVFFPRGWVGYDSGGSFIEEPGDTLNTGDVYYASTDVATILEKYANAGEFESGLGQISTPVFLKNWLPSFSNIPIAADIGGRSATKRKIYAIRLGDSHGDGGTPLQGYALLEDNVTTGPITIAPDVTFAVPLHRSVTPPVAPNALMTAVETSTAVDTSAFLGAEAQAGYWSFKVTGVYRDGTESRGTNASAEVLVDGTKQVRLTEIPTFPTIDGVDCVFRRVYASIYTPFYPIVRGTPDFRQQNTSCVAVILNNTATSLTFPFGGNLSGGEHVPNNVAPGDEEKDGPFLEIGGPEDIDEDSELLLLDPPITVTSDTSQLRNRVYVKGKGSIVSEDAAIGASELKVADVSTFSPTGGKIIIGSRVIAYRALTASSGAGSLILSTPLDSPILQADWLYGGGQPVLPFVQVDDLESQKYFGSIELDDDGEPTDGIHEYTISDDSLTTPQQLFERGLAELELFSREIQTVRYATRDPNTRSGKMVHIDLNDPPIHGDFIIQEVTVDQIHDESDQLEPRYTVIADSAARFNFQDLLMKLTEGNPEKAQGSAAGVVPTAVVATLTDAAFIPVPIGTQTGGGKRHCWIIPRGDAGVSNVTAIGAAAPTVTGGNGIHDSDGYWCRPLSSLGSIARLTAANVFTRADLYPVMKVRFRSSSTLATTVLRYFISLTEDSGGVSVNLPSTSTQRGYYLRYSTDATPADPGWVLQMVSSTGRTVSNKIANIAPATIYEIAMYVTPTETTVTINDQAAVISGAVTGIDFNYEILVQAKASVQGSFDMGSLYLETR